MSSFDTPGTPGSSSRMWEYRLDPTDWTGDLTGYKVEATDDEVGKVDKASNDVGAQSLIVDAGGWLSSKKVLLPASLISRINHEDRKIFVDASKRQIKDAPEYDEDTVQTSTYRDKLGGYYGSLR